MNRAKGEMIDRTNDSKPGIRGRSDGWRGDRRIDRVKRPLNIMPRIGKPDQSYAMIQKNALAYLAESRLPPPLDPEVGLNRAYRE